MKRYTKPIHVPKPLAHRRADSSLALINVVFLLLLFLLVAGTLRPPLPDEFEWAETSSESGKGNIQNSLVLTRSGSLWFAGTELDEQGLIDYLAQSPEFKNNMSVQVDRRAKMEAVAQLAQQMRSAGVKNLSFIAIEANEP
ncbi:biopolymer transporter ExbD [Roseibium album]|uniref:ExbD/TolR family protein n=1 Tax=Roseibium album TaxID=311410 RepID=UPI0018CB3D82|nr:biopolymer transport protein ExbD [Labrenzia sp. EL_126]